MVIICPLRLGPALPPARPLPYAICCCCCPVPTPMADDSKYSYIKTVLKRENVKCQKKKGDRHTISRERTFLRTFITTTPTTAASNLELELAGHHKKFAIYDFGYCDDVLFTSLIPTISVFTILSFLTVCLPSKPCYNFFQPSFFNSLRPPSF